MKEAIDKVLDAAKASDIPEGESGLWSVKKTVVKLPLLAIRDNGKLVEVPPGNYTYLFRLTDATLHQPPGEPVMHDTPDELRTHLEFMLRAKGRVLICGLGLGCVARGCLANPNVESVTVVENSPDVLKLVGRHMAKGRLLIVFGDATKWVKWVKGQFDCAWTDLWTDESAGEPHLQIKHMEVICELADKVKLQGAWKMPRYFRRSMRETANMM